MSPGREQGRAGRTGLHCGGPRTTPSRARSPRSRNPGEEIAGETGRREDAAPTSCGRGAGFPWSGRPRSHPPCLGRPLAPWTWPGGSLPSRCGLPSDQARRWRPGTVARRPGCPRGRRDRGARPPSPATPGRSLQSGGRSRSRAGLLRPLPTGNGHPARPARPGAT